MWRLVKVWPIKYRKKILAENMKEIKNHIMLSETKIIQRLDKDSLTDLMTTVFSEGLEGLVLKDLNSFYEPGKRHWLKIKKDYLADGAMADSADLVVLGAYFGSGSKGGLMSVFLMGVYDPNTFRWCTVTKCGNGFDDKMLKRLQTQLNVNKINKDPTKVPAWLNVTKTLIPDFVVVDPKKSQVWEITGAEFSKSDVHTAGGVSIRFPRFTRLRDDKAVQQATDLPQLLKLFASSKDKSDIPELMKGKKKTGKLDDHDDRTDGDESDDEDEIEVLETVQKPAPDLGKRKSEDVEEPVVKKGKTAEVKPAPDLGKRKSEDVEEPVVKKGKTEEVKPAPDLVKRKSEDAEEPVLKKVRTEETANDDLPLCRYGDKCYQKNPEHRAKFAHATPALLNVNSQASQVLSNVFTGCKFFISDGVSDVNKMKRYIIAFDGDVLNSYEQKFATHIVTDSENKDLAGRAVTSDWVWQCIKKKALVKRC